MKIEVGKTYERKRGSWVEILVALPESAKRDFVGLAEGQDYDHIMSYYSDGTFCTEGVDNNDLIKEVKPKIKGWVNVYGNATSKVLLFGGIIFDTKADADAAESNRIACIEIEFTKGDGLDG